MSDRDPETPPLPGYDADQDQPKVSDTDPNDPPLPGFDADEGEG